MRNIVIGFLVFLTLLAGVLLYVGDDSTLRVISQGAPGFFDFGDHTLSWRKAITFFVIGAIGFILIWSLAVWLVRLPGRLRSGVGLRRRTQALEAMEEALIAGAEGDADKARKRAERVRKLVKSDALGRMISAQAADASGDSKEAIEQYQALLKDERTESAGRRGLAQQYLSSGNLQGAIEQAGTVYKTNKHARWAFDILFQAQMSDYRWKEALETLERGLGRKHIGKDIARRRKAVLDTAIATQLEDDGEMQGAIDLSVAALSAAPDFAPAAALAARLLGKEGEERKAISLLEKAWKRAPHPALSAALLDLLENKSDREREKRVKSFIKQNADHRESILLRVEENLRSGDAVSAWTTLSPMLKDKNATARLCLLGAEAETLLSNEKDAKVLALRAATAPTEPDWSDLDPEGDAFDYSVQDWRRLVYSYGENGELIHPRFESGAARQSVAVTASVVASGTNDISKASNILEIESGAKPEPSIEPSIDQDLPSGEIDTDDIAMRLDSLLGNEEE